MINRRILSKTSRTAEFTCLAGGLSNLEKRDTLDEAIKDLKTDFYLAVIISLNRDNADEVRHQAKVFQTLTASPVCVIAEEPVDVTIKPEFDGVTDDAMRDLRRVGNV